MRFHTSALAVFVATPAAAGFIEIPKSEYYSTTSAALEAIADAASLSEDERADARQIAGQWVYLGPCAGKADDVENLSPRAFEIVINAESRTPFEAAILQMITVINRQNLGRPEHTKCALALAIANAR